MTAMTRQYDTVVPVRAFLSPVALVMPAASVLELIAVICALGIGWTQVLLRLGRMMPVPEEKPEGDSVPTMTVVVVVVLEKMGTMEGLVDVDREVVESEVVEVVELEVAESEVSELEVAEPEVAVSGVPVSVSDIASAVDTIVMVMTETAPHADVTETVEVLSEAIKVVVSVEVTVLGYKSARSTYDRSDRLY